MQQWCFLIFLNFLLFFLNFLLRVGLELIGTIFFSLSYSAFPNLFSLFLDLPQHILPRKAAIIVSSNFLNCFTIFLEFSIMGWVGTRRNDFFIFYFLSFTAFPPYFGLRRSHIGVF